MSGPDRRAARPLELGLLLVMLVCGLGMATCASLRYRWGLSDWPFDLAFFHDLIASAARGEGFSQTASTHERDGLLELSHAFFVLPVFLPFYWLLPRIETLLLIQALVLASGAYPIWRLARSLGSSAGLGILLSLIYVSAPPLWRLSMADFRPLLLSIPLLLWCAWALVEGSLRFILLTTLLAVLVREELPLLIAALALTLWLLRKTGHRQALLAMLVSLGYFGLLFVLRPRMNFYIPFDAPLELLAQAQQSGVAGVPLTRKLEHVLSYFPPGLWSALLAPLMLLAALPLLVYQLLLSSYEWWHWSGPYVHHSAPLLAFGMLAAVLGWVRLEVLAQRKGERGRRILGGLLVLALLAQLIQLPRAIAQPLGLLDSDAEQADRQALLLSVSRLLVRIPPDAAVATDYRWIAHLSGRRVLYCYQSNFERHSSLPAEGLPVPGLDRVDWMLVDVTHVEWLERLEGAADWTLDADQGPYRLYRRVGQPPVVPE